jgi:hypothetical protein
VGWNSGLQGNYPVGRDDAAQLAALQIQAEMGAAFGGAAEPEDALAVCLDRYFTKQVLLTRPHADWMMDVQQRYKALEQFSKEDARMQVTHSHTPLCHPNPVGGLTAWGYGMMHHVGSAMVAKED